MGRRRTPGYWWDFHWDGNRIVSVNVETDADYLPNPVRAFPVSGDAPCDRLIEDVVMPFIADLEAGRIDPRRAQ